MARLVERATPSPALAGGGLVDPATHNTTHNEETIMEHYPVNWFTRGIFPSCSCGFTPRDNSKLIAHWGDLGFKFVDIGGTLTRVEVA